LIPSLDDAIGRKNERICEKVTNDNIKSSVWSPCFPDDYKEIEYSKYSFCTFHFIVDLIERKTGEKFSINQIKNQLFDEYKKYIGLHMDKIIDILIIEGKKTLGDQVYSGTLSFSNLIYTDNYFLTTFDMWLLVVKYQIPTIFISQKTILQTKYEKNEFLAYGTREDDFAFIIVPGLRPENIPGFKIISSNEGDIFISLDKIKEECVERIYNAMDTAITIETFLQEFSKPKKTTYVKKKPNILILDSDSEEVEKPKPKVQRKKKIVVVEDDSEEVVKPKVQRKKKEEKVEKKEKTSKKLPVKEKKTGTKKNIKIEE